MSPTEQCGILPLATEKNEYPAYPLGMAKVCVCFARWIEWDLSVAFGVLSVQVSGGGRMLGTGSKGGVVYSTELPL